MKRLIRAIAVVFVAFPVLAFGLDCKRTDLDPKTAALCARGRSLVDTPARTGVEAVRDMSAAALTAGLGGPSGDPGPAHCAMIPGHDDPGRDNFWKHYLDIVGGPNVNGPPDDPWDWAPNRWCVGTWCIANAYSDPFAEQWHLGVKDENGVRRGSARAWLLNCAPQIWGGAEYVPSDWERRVRATESHVAAWVLHPKKLTPADIARMVNLGGGYRCRTLPCDSLGLAMPIYPPRTVPAAHWSDWSAFVGEVFWHLENPTPENVRFAMAHELTRRAEEELGWPNRPTWPDDGPALTLWRVWSENPPPVEPPDDDCEPCPGCVPCAREHCDKPRDVLLYDFDVKSPPLGDVVVFRPEIAPHAPAKVLEIEHTVTLDELPGKSLALIYAVGDGGDVVYVQVRGRRLVVRAGIGCWRGCGSPKPKKTARLSEKIEVGRPYTMTLRRVQNEGLTVVLRTEHVELARVKMGPEAAPGPFLMARCDAGHDGSQAHKGELPTVGSIDGWATKRE